MLLSRKFFYTVLLHLSNWEDVEIKKLLSKHAINTIFLSCKLKPSAFEKSVYLSLSLIVGFGELFFLFLQSN